VEPGTFQELAPGEEVEFSDPPDAPSTYPAYMKQQLMGVAAATGVPYEVLTGDMAGLNDRVMRVVLHEFRRAIQAVAEQRSAVELPPLPVRAEPWWLVVDGPWDPLRLARLLCAELAGAFQEPGGTPIVVGGKTCVGTPRLLQLALESLEEYAQVAGMPAPSVRPARHGLLATAVGAAALVLHQDLRPTRRQVAAAPADADAGSR